MCRFDSFLVLWPKSGISVSSITGILEYWNCEYAISKIDIPNSISFFQDLYGLDHALAKNKLFTCGFGEAVLVEYRTPYDKIRYRATFTEIKLSNVFNYDLKNALRILEGKNNIHGSTDYSEYLADIDKLKRPKSEGRVRDSDVLSINNGLAQFRRALSPIRVRVAGRVKYTIQKLCASIDYAFCMIVFRRGYRPILRSKWRWSSRYFKSADTASEFFVKSPNRFEFPKNEVRITNYLNDYGLSPSSAELFEYRGRESIRYDFLQLNMPSVSFLVSEKGIQALIRLIRALLECGVVHSDIKPDNLHLSENNHLQVIDLGLAEITKEKRIIRSVNSIKKCSNRSSDGFDILEMVLLHSKLELFYRQNEYLELSAAVGQSVCIGDVVYVTED